MAAFYLYKITRTILKTLLVNLQNILSVILILIKILYNITSDKMYISSLNNGSVKGNN
jgi:hypothetical protein